MRTKADGLALPPTGALIRYLPPAPMSAAVFNAIMEELGMRHIELTTYLGKRREVASRWSSGERPIPPEVAAWLHLARAAKERGVSFERSPGPYGIVKRAAQASAAA